MTHDDPLWILSSVFLTQRRQAEHPWVQSHLSLGDDFLTYENAAPYKAAAERWGVIGTRQEKCALQSKYVAY